jgi:hypothetical protein
VGGGGGGGGGGEVRLQGYTIVHIVPPIKTTDLVPSLTKAQFQLVSKLPLKKRVVTVWGAGKLY